ncbi:MAG TPA: hypothetical protein DEB63_06820 [Agrobacterium sp.]|uniref:hypothetical protein n=1 Tax=Rhizobium sp. TaxID=391 RepID=UPI000E81F2DC|nr:hypothetical protein [Agrobacterium sp.]
MSETNAAALRRIIREFEALNQAFDRYMERVDTAICELDEPLFDRVPPLIGDAVDVSLFLRDAGDLIDALRPIAKG